MNPYIIDHCNTEDIERLEHETWEDDGCRFDIVRYRLKLQEVEVLTPILRDGYYCAYLTTLREIHVPLRGVPVNGGITYTEFNGDRSCTLGFDFAHACNLDEQPTIEEIKSQLYALKQYLFEED